MNAKITVTAEIVIANKQIVDELRALDTHNRKKKESHIEFLRQEIRAGNWTVTNQGIGVTVSGWIADGGHRLEALALEGYPAVQLLIVRGLPDAAQKYVDQHAKRTMTDTLALFFDQSISTRVIAGINVLLKAASGWRGPGKFGPDVMIDEFTKKENAIQRISGIEKSSSLSAPVWAAMVETFHETKDERVITFVEQIIRGEMLQVGDPALVLRNWISSNSGASGGGLVQRERFEKSRNAVLAYLEERRLTKLYARQVK